MNEHQLFINWQIYADVHADLWAQVAVEVERAFMEGEFNAADDLRGLAAFLR